MVQYTRSDLQNLVWMSQYYSLHDIILQAASDGHERCVRCAIDKPLSDDELSKLIDKLRAVFPDVVIEHHRTADKILIRIDWS